MDGIAVNGTIIKKDCLYPSLWSKVLVKKCEKYFQMDNYLLKDRRGYRSRFLHQIVATL